MLPPTRKEGHRSAPRLCLLWQSPLLQRDAKFYRGARHDVGLADRCFNEGAHNDATV
jgi:hypothetical protein